MHISMRLISRLERKIGLVNSLDLSILLIQERLKESFQRYYSLKKEAVVLRESSLLDLEAIKSKYTRVYQQAIYNNLIMRER